MTQTLIHSLPVGTTVKYTEAEEGFENETFTIVEPIDGDSTHDFAVRHGYLSAITHNPDSYCGGDSTDGESTWFSQSEFDDGSVEVVASPEAEVKDFNYSVIEIAIEFKRTIEFSYAKGSGSYIETRRLVPEAVHVGTTTTVIGYDPDRDDVRAYRLDRIKGDVSV